MGGLIICLQLILIVCIWMLTKGMCSTSILVGMLKFAGILSLTTLNLFYRLPAKYVRNFQDLIDTFVNYFAFNAKFNYPNTLLFDDIFSFIIKGYKWTNPRIT
jgi:UDP-N-acetylmuramyl pentapeptide phosphotransferase/UDP-N-acetylglucosamine-1-phosphate transferase